MLFKLIFGNVIAIFNMKYNLNTSWKIAFKQHKKT